MWFYFIIKVNKSLNLLFLFVESADFYRIAIKSMLITVVFSITVTNVKTIYWID